MTNDQELKAREAADDKMISDAFQHLLDTYLASRHRKKVDIITKAFNFARHTRVCAAFRASHTSCTPSPWPR